MLHTFYMVLDAVTKWSKDRVTEWPSDGQTEGPSDRVTKWLKSDRDINCNQTTDVYRDY